MKICFVIYVRQNNNNLKLKTSTAMDKCVLGCKQQQQLQGIFFFVYIITLVQH